MLTWSTIKTFKYDHRLKGNTITKSTAIAKANSKVFEDMPHRPLRFVRYPGGKQRILRYILPNLPRRPRIKYRYIEPFVGGGALFFALNASSAILSDLNRELVELYKGIRDQPIEVWNLFRSFPATKKGYYLEVAKYVIVFCIVNRFRRNEPIKTLN
jgi:site-specific DNA-adenine methylase